MKRHLDDFLYKNRLQHNLVFWRVSIGSIHFGKLSGKNRRKLDSDQRLFCSHRCKRPKIKWHREKQFLRLCETSTKNQTLCLVFFIWAYPGLFFIIFVFSMLFNWQINFCRCLDLNRRSLVSEVTALPTVPQPLPNIIFCLWFSTLWTLLLTMCLL